MDVVVPYNIVDKVCQRCKVNVIATFLSLKTMYKGGSIHHFYKRLKEVSSYTGQSKKTLKSHVNKLIKDGLIRKEGEHLILAEKKTLSEYFGVEVKSHSYKHVLNTSHKVKNIKSQIRKLVIAENQAKQRHALKKKE